MESDLFNNKYRIKSIRLKHWDYSSNGAYYVTICTKNRENYFGEIINGKMKLSEIGNVVEYEWKQTSIIRKNVKLDEYIVMPDHFHGILLINNVSVETCGRMSLQRYNKFSKPIARSISMIINHFKSAVKRWCNKNNFQNFAWQPRFYEHIIRDEIELNQKRKYIINNPFMWELKNNKKFFTPQPSEPD